MWHLFKQDISVVHTIGRGLYALPGLDVVVVDVVEGLRRGGLRGRRVHSARRDPRTYRARRARRTCRARRARRAPCTRARQRGEVFRRHRELRLLGRWLLHHTNWKFKHSF